MDYVEIPAPPELADVVRCLWRMRGRAPAKPAQRIAPDGCPEIVVNHADPFARVGAAGARRQPAALLVGQLTTAITIVPQGEIDLVGVRLHPWGLGHLVDAPAREVVDDDVALTDVAPTLRDRLLAADDVAAVRDALLAARRRTRGSEIAAAAARLLGAGHDPDTAASRAGVSRRTLERAFSRHVGIAPALFGRIRRLQRAIDRARGSRETWAAVAAGCGYFDQAHLIREFRLLAGTTPRRYLEEETEMADLFSAATID